ncbi:hypothetical protein T439DRAFT_384184 [Meredithblackwellia eburnea MCA 4105]
MYYVGTLPAISVEQALSQSRQSILFDLLTLFSTKSKSKSAPQLQQPQHQLTQLSTQNSSLAIGPHSFQAKLFIATWSQSNQKKKNNPPPPPSQPVAPTPSTSTSTPPSSSSAAITPQLILRLNAASAADPVLATLLRKAASGGATNVELGGLARYIETLRREEEVLNPVPTTTTTTQVKREGEGQGEGGKGKGKEVVRREGEGGGDGRQGEGEGEGEKEQEQEQEGGQERPPSIVIEFKESSTERFVLPSHFVFTLLPVDYSSTVFDPPPPTTTPSPVVGGTSSSSTGGTGGGQNTRRRSVLLSFFVTAEDKRKAGGGPTVTNSGKKGKEATATAAEVGDTVGNNSNRGGGTTPPPVPVDIVVEDCTESVRNALFKASRSARKRDGDVEDSYRRMILAIPPRTPIFHQGIVSTNPNSSQSRSVSPPPAPPLSAPSAALMSRVSSTQGQAQRSGTTTPVTAKKGRVRGNKRPLPGEPLRSETPSASGSGSEVAGGSGAGSGRKAPAAKKVRRSLSTTVKAEVVEDGRSLSGTPGGRSGSSTPVTGTGTGGGRWKGKGRA